MKKFYKKSYSWLATLLLAVAFAVSGSASAKSIEIPVGTAQSVTKDDVSVFVQYWTGSQANLYGELDSEWGYLEVSSLAGAITKVEFFGASDMNTVTCLTGTVSGTSTVGVWEGKEQKVRFHSSGDIYVDKIIVYLEDGAITKECTVDVDHFADNVKPGKYEAPFTKYITLYMQEKPAVTSWTGSDNCPEGVTFTSEDGQQIRVAQFNYWVNSDTQVGVVLESEVTAPGVYTLHIPEGIIPFEGGKWNKEITATWTVVEPDLRTKIAAQFDFTKEDYDKSAVVSYMGKELGEVTLETSAVSSNNFESEESPMWGLRAKKSDNGSLTFTAPGKTKITKVVLNNGTGVYNFSKDNVSADSGEVTACSNTSLTWEGDADSVCLTFSANTAISSATVTLADEGILTGIDTVLSTEASNKVYDLIGRRVVNAQNGLFIVNGKKVIR